MRGQWLPEGHTEHLKSYRDTICILVAIQDAEGQVQEWVSDSCLFFLITLYSWMSPASSAFGGGFQETRMAVPLASVFVTVTPWGALLGAKTKKHTINNRDINRVADIVWWSCTMIFKITISLVFIDSLRQNFTFFQCPDHLHLTVSSLELVKEGTHFELVDGSLLQLTDHHPVLKWGT